MEMNELRYFIAVAKTQNIHQASENIGISTGSLSKAITRLENELGVKLFNRTGRGITISKQGVFLKARAQKILNMESDIKFEILGKKSSFNAVIGGEEALLSKFGVELASSINSLFPDSNVELRALKKNQLQAKLNNNEIHIALSTQKLSDNFFSKKLIDVKFHTVIGPGHPLFKKSKKGEVIPVKELLKYSFVTPSIEMLGKTTELQDSDGWRDNKFPRLKSYTTSSLRTLESLVINGHAAAYLPDYLVENNTYQILNISGCPYQCKQQVYLNIKSKNELGWINQVI